MIQIKIVFLIVILGLLTACNEIRYYKQSAQGQFDMVSQARDISEVLADDDLDAELHNKLVLVLQAREFAGDALDLSFNNSYTRYVDLNRNYAVKNLYAAEEFSTQLYSWCYPIIGCANYRGYFDTAMLSGYRAELDERGYDTYIGHVTAYSTLGWFDDPALNTFIALPDYRLVGLIFHEPAHQQLYIGGDTSFNESFATAVEQAGLEQFYAPGTDASQLENYRLYRKRLTAQISLATQARLELEIIYRQPLSDASKRQHKEQVFTRLARQFTGLAKSHGSTASTIDNTVFNNARLGAMAAYNEYVPAFLNILESHRLSFPKFYAHVSKLSQLAPEDRELCLIFWAADEQSANMKIPPMCQA